MALEVDLVGSLVLISSRQKKPKIKLAEITDDSHKVKERHKHRLKQTKAGFVQRRVSNMDVMGKHLIVTFFMILPTEKKSLCNITYM